MPGKRPHEQLSGNTPPDLAVGALAARQHGVVRTGDLLALGLDTSAINKRVKAGRLYRKDRGVYAVGHAQLSREGELLAAVFAAGEGALLSHLAAAELYRLRRYRASLIEVVVPCSRESAPGTHFQKSRSLHPDDYRIVRRIPVTSPARLFVDLTDVLIAEDLADVIHEAAYRGLFNPRATREAMQRANGRHNLHILEEALALNATGSAGLKSRNEATFLSMLKLNDLPVPKINVHLAGEEIDFHWPALRLAVEIDGPGHRRPRTNVEDRAKERVLEQAGYQLLRFTDEDLRTRPEAVLQLFRTSASSNGRG